MSLAGGCEESPMEEDPAWPSQPDDDDGYSGGQEKLACQRCRQRKVKCNRGSPCSHCVKSGAECSYADGPKPRERRQRVMVSKTYDSKLDAISKKIDILGHRMSQLSTGPTKSQPPIAGVTQNLTPFSSSLESTPNTGTLSHDTTADLPAAHTSKPEFQGESSLFAHAAFASRFLQNAIDKDPDTKVSREMGTVLEDLRSAVQSGKQQPDTIEKLYPYAKPMPPGSTIRNLALPPMDKVFTCFRMAKEYPQVAMLWLGNFMRPSQFSDYFFKVASSGPATEADLVIVHGGLYWLFNECSKVTASVDLKQNYDEQASLCKANIETVLVNLRFHHSVSMDSAYAMGIATMYCLQKRKPGAAWQFIISASQIVQALGLQHNAPPNASPEDKSQKADLFWTIYLTEKMLSLRLGRSSTFRDQDITLSQPTSGAERSSGSLLAEMAPNWVSMAAMQGRIYDDVYSPGALLQSPEIRTARARTLADDLKVVIQQGQEAHDQYKARKAHILGLEYHEIAKRADRVVGLCLLTLVYRGVPPEKPATSAFYPECVDTAREALEEHERCVRAIDQGQGKTVMLEAYINWNITQSPFIPFIILFCNVIETCEATDLGHMQTFVETLEATLDSQIHTTCDKQYRLFKSLFNVAIKYVEVRTNSMQTQSAMEDADAPSRMMSQSMSDTELLDELMAQPDAFGTDLDPEGAHLWDWFDKSQSIMRMLDT